MSVKDDYQGKRSEVLSTLREVANLADESGAVTLAKKLKGDRIPRLEEEKFHLVVLGEFNHGKTTFVNALLGAPILPMGVTPTTAVIHQVVHGERSARVVEEGGGERAVAWGDVGSYVVGGTSSAAVDSVRYLEVHYPSAMLAGGVVLVDTPGVNDLNSTRAEITYSYIPRADAVIFLLDANQILKESERRFLSEKLLAQSRDKVIFVINKVDLLEPAEKEQALAYAHTQLSKLVADPKIYAVSAEGALNGDRQGSGLARLEEELTRFLTEDRGRVLLDNALDEGIRTAATLQRGIEVQRQALAMEKSELERRLKTLEGDLVSTAQAHERREKQIRESLAALKALVRKECDDFGKRFAQALPAEIESSKADDLKRYLPGFIEERFRSFADKQGMEIAKRVETITEEAIAFVSDEAKARGEKIAEAFPGTPDVNLKVDTMAYDVGVIALGAFGATLMFLSNVAVGGAMLLATPVLAWVFRGQADKALKARANEEAPAAVQKAAGELAEAFAKQIDDIGDKLIEFVRNASEEMTRSIAEVVRHARDAHAEGESRVATVKDDAVMALGRLTSVQSRMGALRTALWANGTGTSGE